jgi:hypothetical protein
VDNNNLSCVFSLDISLPSMRGSCSAESPYFDFSLPSMRGLTFRGVTTPETKIIFKYPSTCTTLLRFSLQVAYCLCLKACRAVKAKATLTCIIGFLKVIHISLPCIACRKRAYYVFLRTLQEGEHYKWNCPF